MLGVDHRESVAQQLLAQVPVLQWQKKIILMCHRLSAAPDLQLPSAKHPHQEYHRLSSFLAPLNSLLEDASALVERCGERHRVSARFRPGTEELEGFHHGWCITIVIITDLCCEHSLGRDTGAAPWSI